MTLVSKHLLHSHRPIPVHPSLLRGASGSCMTDADTAALVARAVAGDNDALRSWCARITRSCSAGRWSSPPTRMMPMIWRRQSGSRHTAGLTDTAAGQSSRRGSIGSRITPQSRWVGNESVNRRHWPRWTKARVHRSRVLHRTRGDGSSGELISVIREMLSGLPPRQRAGVRAGGSRWGEYCRRSPTGWRSKTRRCV